MSPFDILGGLLAVCPCVGAALLWRAERKARVKPADAPTLDCGCTYRGVQYTCMHCNHTRCAFHRDHKHVCLDRDGDLIPAEPGVEPPAIVAGPQLLTDYVAEQFAGLAKSAPELDELDVLAEYYLLPEVTQ